MAINGNNISMSIEELTAQCTNLLQTFVVDVYLPHSVDDANHGGYHEHQGNDDDNKKKHRFQPGDKSLEYQARHLWLFSRLLTRARNASVVEEEDEQEEMTHRDASASAAAAAAADEHDDGGKEERDLLQREDALQAATSGYEFLLQHYLDPVHGGYIAKTDRTGTQTIDSRKVVKWNAGVLMALVEFYHATGTEEALQHAMDLFDTLEQNCYDTQHGGYHECFDQDWSLLCTSEKKMDRTTTTHMKSYETHLQILDSFTQLYMATKDGLVAKRLHELIHLLTVTFRHSSYPCNVDYLAPDWTTATTTMSSHTISTSSSSSSHIRVNYGHDLHCTYLVLEAVKALGMDVSIFLSWATRMGDYAIEYGYDNKEQGSCSGGGFHHSGPVGETADDQRKTQPEQMLAFLGTMSLYRATSPGSRNHELYRDVAIETLLSFVSLVGAENDMTINNKNNRVVQQPSASGSIDSSQGDGAYPIGRAMMLCQDLLLASGFGGSTDAQ